MKTCDMCGRARTPEDVLEYDPRQMIYGTDLGWYSGRGGELCPDCMARMMNGT